MVELRAQKSIFSQQLLEVLHKETVWPSQSTFGNNTIMILEHNAEVWPANN